MTIATVYRCTEPGLQAGPHTVKTAHCKHDAMCCFPSGYMRHIRFVVLPLLIIFAACRSSGSISTGTAEPASPAASLPASVPVPSEKSWSVSPVPALRRYRVSTEALFEIGGIRDSIASRITLSISQQATETPAIISGIIDSFAIQPGSRIGSPALVPQLPVAFSGTLRQSEVRLEQQTIDCSAQIPISAVVQKIAWNVPRELHVGQSWTDSSTIPSCSGSIPISLKTVRAYRIVGEDNTAGIRTILITRTDRTSSTGEGSQEQHQVRISGSGTGNVNLWIDAQNGSLVRSAGNYSGTSIFTASGQTQVFTQRAREIIEEIR